MEGGGSEEVGGEGGEDMKLLRIADLRKITMSSLWDSLGMFVMN
jgi:hypothetical protein